LLYLFDKTSIEIVFPTIVFLVAGNLSWWLFYRGIGRMKAAYVAYSGLLAGVSSVFIFVVWSFLAANDDRFHFAAVRSWVLLAIIVVGPLTITTSMLAALTNYVLLEKLASLGRRSSPLTPPTSSSPKP
jgi:hypothetical protein